MNLPALDSLPVAVLVALSLCGPVCARAQTAAAEQVVSPAASGVEGGPVQVEVTALREPIEFPYQRAYNAALKVRDASHGSTDLVVSIADTQPTNTPLRVSLQYGETVQPLVVDPSNTFTVSPDRVALENNAILTANRRRGGLSVQVGLRPHVEPGTALTRADINRLVEGGKAARKALVPWYARVFIPSISAVRICSLAAEAEFALRSPDGVSQPLPSKGDKDVYERPAHCVDLAPTDDAREAAMSVVMPPESTVDYAPATF